VHYMARMDDIWLTETDVAGSLFDLEEMERLRAATQRGCWFWLDWEIALMYRDFDDRMSQISCPTKQ
jgi:hypothetical protein